ncbi:MAG TPA: apolipoprotein N-acyltransferase [Polyangia bacterium]
MRERLVQPGAVALSAALLIAACPGVLPWRSAGLLAWVALVPLLWVLPRVPVRRAALLAFATGLLAQLGFTPWYPGLLARFSGWSPVTAVAVWLPLAALGALGWAAWGVAARTLRPLALMAPAAFVVAERWLPVVFPQSLALTQYRQVRLAQVVELGGPAALTFLMIFANAALARALQPGRRRARYGPLAAAAVAVAGALLFGSVRLAQIDARRQAAPSLRVGLVQADAVRRGFRAPPADDAAQLERYQRLSAQLERELGPVDLLLWPEKAYPLLLRADARHDYHASHRGRIRRGFTAPLLFGVNSVDVKTRALWNSVAHLAPDGALRVVYDKVKLILYSERGPAWLPGGVRYRAGARREPLELDAGGRRVRLSLFICFESTFPAYVRDLAGRGPDLLVNLSDDAWFGAAVEPAQHLAHTVLRAIEARRDLVRATGAGVSALVTAAGRVEAENPLSLSPEDHPLLVVEPRLIAGRSLFVRVGELVGYACGLLTAVALVLGLRRRQAARRGILRRVLFILP